MNILFSSDFKLAVKKHSSIKKAIKKKVDMIISNPIALGEPLKGNFRGFYSCPVKKSYLIIFLYCHICRRKNDDEIVLCHDCELTPDQTIKFVTFGPHDEAYQKK
jgi:addiction module RelE/StbE family toxin